MATNTQEVIDGLRAGTRSLEILSDYCRDHLNQMADLGASEPYEKLRVGYSRLTELKTSMVNLYTLLELTGVSGLWQPNSPSKPQQKGTTRGG